MNEQNLLKRITVDRKILDGKPAIRERLTVENALELIAAGETFETMVKTYPWLEQEDIQACLLYARQLVRQEQAKLSDQPPQTLEELIEFVPQILEQVPYLKLLVLFGSRARGDHDANSDWDFAFLCDEELRKQYEKGGFDFLRIWGVLQQIYKLGDDQIDAIEMKECSDLLAHNIAKDGQILYELEPGEFERFQQQKLMSKEQLKFFRQQQRESIRSTLEKLRR
ncbi:MULTISPECIES: type VII toxin-antitoxin system MntA family adenylyltransferase antitoxin [unclassified Leptolyngbya]|uniref:type VII toxin-antitoxin system MntA family adenylyltransferase antitoxin n=1 Tax=unclassified Leptolyngbya TaxID=2650499 RepID=UPI001AD149AE|nr:MULTISPECIES: DUF433 domain-containing protein [unclassified Leptolyngbya]MBN8563526.1 DUF433 domain-containing protein [Leptolyngbya sp. UWPOB_LEPTO1]MCY6494423.1 DUF433 domain-containing protein [Leptolyngbya sp. GGD]